jgi:quinolinate synthase
MQRESPEKRFVAANEAAVCRYMKMITLPKVRDSLQDLKFEVRVPEEIAERARIPIERMVSIG